MSTAGQCFLDPNSNIAKLNWTNISQKIGFGIIIFPGALHQGYGRVS
jgi:hypothetical protein